MNVENSFTKTPNKLYELLPEINSLAVLSVIMVFIRQSSGYHRRYAHISHNEFKKATGLGPTSVSKGIQKAVESGYLYIDKNNPGKNGKTCYRYGYKFNGAPYSIHEIKMDLGVLYSNWTNHIFDEITTESVVPSDEIATESVVVHENQITTESVVPSDEITTESVVIQPQITTESVVHIKKVVFKEKKDKRKNTLRLQRSHFLLLLIQELIKLSEKNDTTDELEDLDKDQSEIDFSKKPYSEEEYNYFVKSGRVSEKYLSESIFVPIEYDDEIYPCSPWWESRKEFRPMKKISDWQKLVGVVQHFYPENVKAYATKIAQQLAGKAKVGDRKYFNFNPTMDPIEAYAFYNWLKECERLNTLPERAERLQERALQFRSLHNLFEHLNHAEYRLRELFQEPAETPDIDPKLLETAPQEEQDRVYKMAEELLGFPLDGDF